MNSEVEAIAEKLSRLMLSIVDKPEEELSVCEYRLKDIDVIVNSEQEMLIAPKEVGAKIVRNDTNDIWCFQGGDYTNLDNYYLLATCIPTEPNTP